MDILTGSARVTNAALMAKIAELELRLGGQAPVSAKAAAPTFYTKAQIAAGGGFPCTLGCGKVLRTSARAEKHGVEEGHAAAK